MKIALQEITIRDLTEGYQDNDEAGVVGYSGKLDIRPPYQREFIYKDKQRDAVIDTITRAFPLNVRESRRRERCAQRVQGRSTPCGERAPASGSARKFAAFTSPSASAPTARPASGNGVSSQPKEAISPTDAPSGSGVLTL